MNLGEVQSVCRMKLQDLTGAFWSDADLLRYANEVYWDLVESSEANLRHASIDLVDGQRVYDLPSDCYEIRTVRVNGNKMFGSSAYKLNDLDLKYLTTQGNPEWYYLEGSKQIAFYPIPDSGQTTSSSLITFTSERGEVMAWNPGTAYTFESEYGVVISAADTGNVDHFTFSSMLGVVTTADSSSYIGEIFYVYGPVDLTSTTQTLDLPGYMHWAMVYGMLELAFRREGRTKNAKLMAYYGSRFNELKEEWFARNKEWARGQDQMLSQQPVDWGSDLQWRDRVWP